jgi:hypothetical protein
MRHWFLLWVVGIGQSIVWAQSTSALKPNTPPPVYNSSTFSTTTSPSSQTQTPSNKKNSLKLSPTKKPASLNTNNSKNQKYVPSKTVQIKDPKIQFNDNPNKNNTIIYTAPNAKTKIPQVEKTPHYKRPQIKLPTTRVGDDSAPRQRLYFLNVQRSNGGSVELNPAPADPAHPAYPTGTDVVITPRPSGLFKFSHWEGGPCRPTVNRQACKVYMNSDIELRPHFILASSRQLILQVSGRGRVVSSPNGLDCGDGHEQCTITRTDHLPITLTATPRAHQEFRDWHVMGNSDACRDNRVRNHQSTCVVRMGASNLEVRVDFTHNKILTVQSAPNSTGEGGVGERSLQWNCNLPGQCFLVVADQRNVRLSVTPHGHSVLTGWSVVDGNRTQNFDGHRNELGITVDHDKTVNITLQSAEDVSDQLLSTNGCQLTPGTHHEYTCHTLNSYIMCQQAFQNGTVQDCHAGNFTATAFEELRTTTAPAVNYTGTDASITVIKRERGSRQGVRSGAYHVYLQIPPPLAPDTSICNPDTQHGPAICERGCSHMAALREDAQTGATISLVRLADQCNADVTGNMSPSNYDALKAYDMCRAHAQAHGINLWNFTLQSQMHERVGAVYYFTNNRTHGRANNASVEPGAISYKRTELVEPPLQIHCRE